MWATSVHGVYYSMPLDSRRRRTTSRTPALVNVTNKTALRLPQDTIDRIRTLARRKSESNDKDIAWPVVGRELIERALLEEERRATPELLQLA